MTRTVRKKKYAKKAAEKPKLEKYLKKKKKNIKLPKNHHLQIQTTHSDSDSADPNPDSIQKLLEPYTKDQLIGFLIDAAVNNPSLHSRIRDTADRDISHRKIFAHGLGWDTTRETLVAAFKPYGEIEDCNVVTDRNTGKTKGFGFIIFKSRLGADKALKEPKKKVSNRIVSCQLASVGSIAASDTTNRKIYVSNVHHSVDSLKLRAFFEKFGEIETGPIGFDAQTGKSRGFAMFVYKNQLGAKKALEEPYKMFDGHQLHCQLAADGKNNKGNNASVTTVLQPVQAPMLAAVAAAQNLALFGQQPGLNSLYGGLFANPNTGLMNPLLGGGVMGQGVVGSNQIGQVGMGLGGYGGAVVGHGLGNLAGSQSVLGPYGASTTAPVFQGLQHAYPGSQIGQASTSKGSGTLSGYPSYM